MTIFFESVEEKLKDLEKAIISEERKSVLQPLIDYLQEKKAKNENINLNFICTHNSRRSHIAQIWGQTLASYFEIPSVFCYSGGTENTRLYPTVLKTFQQFGFETIKLSKDDNSLFAIKHSKTAMPIIAFSKVYNNKFNPQANFCALMTCSQADEDCPFVAGSEKRIAIPYEDPNFSDGTPQEAEKYAETALLIGAELYYVFSKIA